MLLIPNIGAISFIIFIDSGTALKPGVLPSTLPVALGSSSNTNNAYLGLFMGKKEIKEDAESFGDDRRSELVLREEAQAFSETELIGSEPITVVLSEAGWVRSAKGHELDPESLAYKSGDKLKLAAMLLFCFLFVVVVKNYLSH